MVDCFDRIAVQMTEIVLEPVQQLAQRPSLTSVTVLLPSQGRRVLLTVAKRWSGDAVGFVWKLERGDADGTPVATMAASPAAQRWPRPEDAFWAAVDALCTTDQGHRDAIA